jgi:hypothetical protein
MYFYNWIFIYFLPIKNVSGWSLTGQKQSPAYPPFFYKLPFRNWIYYNKFGNATKTKHGLIRSHLLSIDKEPIKYIKYLLTTTTE